MSRIQDVKMATMVDLTELTDEQIQQEHDRREKLKAEAYEIQWRERQEARMRARSAAMKAMFSIYNIPEAEQGNLYTDVLDFYFNWDA